MKRFWKIAAIVAMIAMLGVATVAAVAYAQESTTGSSSVWDFGQRVKEAIASALGITVEKYDETVAAAQKQVIEQGVTEGWLTQDQADQMQQRLDQQPEGGWPGIGPMGPGMGHGFDGMGRGFGDQGSLVSVAADKLGMTDQELMTELRSGKSIADVAKEKGVDTQVISDAYLAKLKANLDTQVKNGKLTQKMADALLEQATQNLPTQLSSTMWNDWGRGPGASEGLLIKVAADKLGLTEAKLMSELGSGKSIANLAKDKGVDTQVISDAYLAELKANLDTQVKNGTLTQDKADSELATAKEKLPTWLAQTTWDDWGRGRGRGGHGDWPGQAPDTSGQGGL